MCIRDRHTVEEKHLCKICLKGRKRFLKSTSLTMNFVLFSMYFYIWQVILSEVKANFNQFCFYSLLKGSCYCYAFLSSFLFSLVFFIYFLLHVSSSLLYFHFFSILVSSLSSFLFSYFFSIPFLSSHSFI